MSNLLLFWVAMLGALLTRAHNDISKGPLLAVSRTESNKITLITLDPEERELETITVKCKGPFGLAFAHERDWLYTACWDHSKIALIDLKNHTEPKVFTGAKLPAWIRRRDETEEIWVSNEGAAKVTIYRSGGSTVLAEIATGQGPSDIVFSDAGRKAWVSNETSRTVSLLDAERPVKLRDIPVGKTPQGMAFNSKKEQLVVANFGSNSISLIDTRSAHKVADIPVCAGPVDVATSAKDGSELAYVSCFSAGAVAVVDLNKRQEIQRLTVGGKPFGIVTHPDGGRIYVCTGNSNQLIVLQVGRISRILRRMPLDGNPLRLTLAP